MSDQRSARIQIRKNLDTVSERQHDRLELADARLAHKQQGVCFLRSWKEPIALPVLEDHKHKVPVTTGRFTKRPVPLV